MKKIPTLFKRVFDEKHRIVEVLPEINDELVDIFDEECVPTIKQDGSACMIRDGVLYKRYDAKKLNHSQISHIVAHTGAIPCQNAPDSITGHFPMWMPCDEGCPSDKWFFKAFEKYLGEIQYKDGCQQIDGTYEAVGPHFNGNKHNLTFDTLRRHGEVRAYSGYDLRTYKGIKRFLEETKCEGLVYWKRGVPVCKIKRSDFGLEW